MVWHREPALRVTQDNVSASLAIHVLAQLLKGPNGLLAGADGTMSAAGEDYARWLDGEDY